MLNGRRGSRPDICSTGGQMVTSVSVVPALTEGGGMTDLSVWTDEERPVRRHKRRRKKKDRKGGFAVALSLVLVLVFLAGGAALVFGAGAKIKDAFGSS